jgi:competence protein ComEC
LKQRQIRSILRIQEPDAVSVLPQEPGFDWDRSVDAVRRRAHHVLDHYLGAQKARIAAALLLGSRTELPEETRIAFAETGMMHVLALSGINVGILAALVWFFCRLMLLSPRTATILALAAVFGLAVISGGRPPIVRATVFLSIATLGRLFSRQTDAINILGLSAMVILAWNPSDLFDVGAQLSFLAVMGILIAASWSGLWNDGTPLAPDESQLENRFGRMAPILKTMLWRYLSLMIAIWLLTAPLIAAEFNLISPIGILLNAFLVPLVTGILWSGYVLLAVGAWMPLIAWAFAFPMEAALSVLLETVDWGAGVWLGHFDVAGPPLWWLCGYYLLLAGLYVSWPKIERPIFTGLVSVLCWTALGLALPAWPHAPKGLRCTFLSVGHGSAILVEFPSGKTLLFDAGALDDGERAFEVIRTALWERGITRLDAVALSHSDLDHVNAIFKLSEEVPIGTVLVARSFFQSPQEVVPYLVMKLKAHDIPIRAVGADDRLVFDPLVTVEVEHPDPRKSYRHNNANSLVIRFTLAGRTLLLMGDVEREGLVDLMAREAGKIDVLQSPHHGSRTANTPEFVRWADPTVVVACTGLVPGRTEELESLYGESVRLLTTEDNGAVTVEMTREGQLLVDHYLKRTRE